MTVAVRELPDDRGVTWTVWDVLPYATARPRPRADGSAAAGRESLLGAELDRGWLCFESPSGERRRLAPIPDGWEALGNAQLSELLARATPLPARRERLID